MPKLEHPYAWLFCAFAALGACLYGYDGVYFTGVTAIETFIEHFGTKQSDGTFAISSSQLSLMTSVINIGELVGSLIAAPLNDYLGRKGVFLVASIVIIVGVILQVSAESQTSYIIGGRILLGFGVGNFSATSPLYIGVSSSSY
jgi:SP family sugar:H+ symporter-like MFS transporter